MIVLAGKGRDVIVLVQQHQMELGEGAEWGGAIVTGLDGECVILHFLPVKDLCGANGSGVTVDGEPTSVVLTCRQSEMTSVERK